MIKIVLATTIFGGLYTSHIVSAQENNTDKLHSVEIAVNKAFINQFPYGEQFMDEDGVLATRIKAPDTAVNTKPKEYEKEVTRKVNFKDKKTGKTLSRVYQTIRFYGKGDPLVFDRPEYKEEQIKDIPPVIDIPKKEKPKVSEEPKEETTQEEPKESENTIPETTTEEMKVPRLPQTGESFNGGILRLAFASLIVAMLILKKTLKEYKK